MLRDNVDRKRRSWLIKTSAVRRELTSSAGSEDWHLLSISIDPAHDTPERLTEYAKGYRPDPAHWSFATGDAAEIQKLAGFFGLSAIREGASLDHNLRTVVVDRAGRVRTIFTGNEWKPRELVDEMKRALEER